MKYLAKDIFLVLWAKKPNRRQSQESLPACCDHSSEVYDGTSEFTGSSDIVLKKSRYY